MNLPTLKPITNRDSKTGKYSLPADGFYQLAPKGEFPHAEGKVVQVIDDESAVAIVNRFNQESQGAGFVGVLVDYEHFSYDLDKKSEAAGWITALENRADGLYGKIDWTPDAQSQLESGAYRFISPTWLPKDVKVIGNRRIRPLRLDTAGLTNTPKLKGLAPLSNRQGDPALQFDNDNNTSKTMEKIRKELGLPADAGEDAVVAGIAQLKNRATTAETANQNLLAAQVESDLAKYSNRYAPEKRDEIKKQLLANREGTIAILDSIPEPQGKPAPAAGKAPLHNRQNAKAPTASPAGPSADVYAKQDLEVRAYMNRNRCDYDSAFRSVMAEKPELFPDVQEQEA
ncbi:MAG TPA: phage protease [Methylomirabilota bacterium]|nr:phage protease [Methylomirabilota bacterium]